MRQGRVELPRHRFRFSLVAETGERPLDALKHIGLSLADRLWQEARAWLKRTREAAVHYGSGLPCKILIAVQMSAVPNSIRLVAESPQTTDPWTDLASAPSASRPHTPRRTVAPGTWQHHIIFVS